MPNCDWYGTIDDHRFVLEFVFAQAEISVWENASDFEISLRRFTSPDAVLAQFEKLYPTGKPWKAVHLQLYVEGSCLRGFHPTRINLNKSATGSDWRELANGFGLIQLYLERPDSNISSHTNHNSAKRAASWDQFSDDDSAADWDFALVTRVSSRINRFIPKNAAAKIGPRPVLPNAARLMQDGQLSLG